MQTYDFIIAGGGAAGLSLAYHLAKSPLGESRILIIDKDSKTQNDRTWCYWSREPTLFDRLSFRTWDRLGFVSDDLSLAIPLGDYRYRMIRGIDFYHFTREELNRCPNITFLQGEVERIEDGQDLAAVSVDGERFSGSWVFDSLFRSEEFNPKPESYHYLKQHFKGWEIQTPVDAFDPGLPILFDFRTPQEGRMRFIYILPFSPREALVEYTLFSADLLKPEAYQAGLRDYIARVMKLPDYRILSEENGIILMTDQPFPRKGGQRILFTGTRGGRVKPSTGYAFLRIQQDSAAIVRSLQQHGHPFEIPQTPGRYRLFDSIMLQLMYRRGGDLKGIFTELFQHNPIERIFGFLDETGSALDNARLMLSLPVIPFIQALWKIKIARKI